MWTFIWHTFFFDPVYNTLVFFIDTIPHGDVGVAIIATVIVIKLVILPLSIKVAKMQTVMREIEPKMKEIKETITDREAQAKAMMELYKDANINPFASIFLMFLQFPIVIALYLAVIRGGGVVLPAINEGLLYSFIPNPDVVSMLMLGVFDITLKSLPLALVAGITQFIQVKLSMPKLEPKKVGEVASLKDEFSRSMNVQMRYVMPVIIVFVAYTFSAAIALYFTVSNLMGIVTELIVKKHRTPKENNEA